MATARQAINKAKSFVGVKEGPEADRLIIDPWNKATNCKPPAKSKKNPWCAIYTASVYIQVKAAGYSKAATCKSQKAYYKKQGRWRDKSERPAAGEVIFVTGHEGIVTSTSYKGTGKFTSGNCKNAVRETSFNWKKGAWGDKKIEGYGKPIFK